MDAEVLMQLLRPSVISGLVRLRARLQSESELPIEIACKMLESTYDGAGLDLQNACLLHELIAPEIVERQALYRHAIRVVALKTSPPWYALMRSGRKALVAANPDVLTCFKRAGAFDSFPAPQIVEWWDELASFAFAGADVDRMTTGRIAERLSIEHEECRLAGHADAPKVIWKSLDSNMAGYDIQSWVLLEDGWAPKYIEVKGSTRGAPRVHVTRHEWDTAVRHRTTYTFQIWDITLPQMTEISVGQVESHIPTDNGRGTWEEVIIQLSKSILSPAVSECSEKGLPAGLMDL